MTTKNTNSRLCTDCGVRRIGTGPQGGWEDPEFAIENKLCFPCADEGQMDIAHNNGHESIEEDDCWYCHPELDPRTEGYTPKQGHTNGIAKTYKSHAACKHAVTPAARAKCRKDGGPKAPTTPHQAAEDAAGKPRTMIKLGTDKHGNITKRRVKDTRDN